MIEAELLNQFALILLMHQYYNKRWYIDAPSVVSEFQSVLCKPYIILCMLS